MRNKNAKLADELAVVIDTLVRECNLSFLAYQPPSSASLWTCSSIDGAHTQRCGNVALFVWHCDRDYNSFT